MMPNGKEGMSFCAFLVRPGVKQLHKHTGTREQAIGARDHGLIDLRMMQQESMAIVRCLILLHESMRYNLSAQMP